MTLKALILALIGIAGISGLSYFNDAVMQQTYLVGNNLPFAIYGSGILFVLIINPLLGLISRRLAFTGRELAVALALTLFACCIPGSGLLRTFTPSLMLPHHFERVQVGWQEQGVLDMAPARMLAEVSDPEDPALTGFMQGMGSPAQHISTADIPWHAWRRTFLFWIPLILVFWFGLLALGVVVHKQWSDHEQLAYPIARFTDALLPKADRTVSQVFQQKLFWLGTIVILVIHLNNYAVEWFPQYLIKVPTTFDFTPLGQLFPTFVKGGGGWWPLLYIPLYFTPLAIAYFMASDVAFSLGIGGYLFTYIAGVFAIYGVSLRGGGMMSPEITKFLGFGAFVGMFLVMLYTGRTYYSAVCRRAFLLPSRERVWTPAVWGLRMFGLCLLAVILNLVWVGLSWPLAILYTLCLYLLFLVMGRIMAESGAFFVQPWWTPGTVLVGFLGMRAIGPQALLIMLLLSTTFLIDPRESLMPFVVNSLKVVDLNRGPVGRVAAFGAVALVIGMSVALPVTMYFQYDRGINRSDRWASEIVPKLSFDETVRVKQRLAAQGTLEQSMEASTAERMHMIKPDGKYVFPFVVGLALVLLFTAARLRWTWWPLHPIMFLVWYSVYTGRIFCASFLVGWFIKVCIVKYGGASVYQRMKPLFFGIIAGDALGGLIPIIIGFIYYLITQEPPKSFRVLPG